MYNVEEPNFLHFSYSCARAFSHHKAHLRVLTFYIKKYTIYVYVCVRVRACYVYKILFSFFAASFVFFFYKFIFTQRYLIHIDFCNVFLKINLPSFLHFPNFLILGAFFDLSKYKYKCISDKWHMILMSIYYNNY